MTLGVAKIVQISTAVDICRLKHKLEVSRHVFSAYSIIFMKTFLKQSGKQRLGKGFPLVP